ncbi:ABC transporter permease [Nocardia sp. alder85J]|uniref:ABC transporter permease n=1 Tax=Nocardia sp. alder85J TaxID=2862949 RepID=UPI001CD1E4F8|nr:ABC transporter permease [Nocardia sp. alder85J]MCX4094200.1 ABC transporter permease [Nocardia sp. alder85J]
MSVQVIDPMASGYRAAPAPPRPSALRQCWVLALRLVRPSLRNGEVLTALLAPSVFTIGFFVPLNRVMSGVGHGSGSYAQFLMPMIVMQAVAFCATAAAFRSASDTRDGLDTRFATMPMPLIAPLVARTAAVLYRTAIALAAAVVCGLVIGFRFHGSWWQTVAFVLFALSLGVLLGAIGDLVGGLSGSPEAATQALILPQLILGMVSTGFVPADRFPSWMRAFAHHQPVSRFVAVMRALAGDVPGAGTPVTWGTVGPGLAWTVAGLVVFGGACVLLAVRRQR